MTDRTEADRIENLRAAWDALEGAQDDFYGITLKAKELAAKADKAQDRVAAAAAVIAKILAQA